MRLKKLCLNRQKQVKYIVQYLMPGKLLSPPRKTGKWQDWRDEFPSYYAATQFILRSSIIGRLHKTRIVTVTSTQLKFCGLVDFTFTTSVIGRARTFEQWRKALNTQLPLSDLKDPDDWITNAN